MIDGKYVLVMVVLVVAACVGRWKAEWRAPLAFALAAGTFCYLVLFGVG